MRLLLTLLLPLLSIGCVRIPTIGEGAMRRVGGVDGGVVLRMWRSGDRIVATTASRREILLSEDRGDHWRPVRVGPEWRSIEALILTPTAMIGAVAQGSSLRILRSTTEGATWSEIHRADLRLRQPGSLQLQRDPATGRILLLAGGTLLVSEDDGVSWREIASEGFGDGRHEIVGMAGDSALLLVWGHLHMVHDGGRRRAIDSVGRMIGRSLYRATLTPAGSLIAAPGTRGAFRSEDGGVSWDTIRSIDPERDRIIAFASGEPGRLHAWVHRFATRTAAPPGGPELLLFRSGDDGRSWQRLATPPLTEPADLIAYGETLLVGTPSGMMRSVDGGATWRSAPLRGSGRGQVSALVAPAPDTLVMIAEGRLYRSTDAGRTWSDEREGMGDRELLSLTQTGGLPMLLLTRNRDSSLTLMTSRDRGASWRDSLRLSRPVPGGVITAGMGGELFAHGGEGLWRSVDGGGTWQVVDRNVEATALSFLERGMPVATGRATFYRPVRGDWMTFAIKGGRAINGIAVAPEDVIYATFGNSFLYFSFDFGESWSYYQTPVGEAPLTALAIDPSGRRLYIGTAGDGVLVLGE